MAIIIPSGCCCNPPEPTFIQKCVTGTFTGDCGGAPEPLFHIDQTVTATITITTDPTNTCPVLASIGLAGGTIPLDGNLGAGTTFVFTNVRLTDFALACGGTATTPPSTCSASYSIEYLVRV